MDHHYLNSLYFQYTSGIIERGKFEGLVYQYFLNNQDKTGLSHWNSDDYKDYLSWIYPRLRNTIDSYQDTGSSFEAYISSVIHHTAREYRVKLITNSVIEYAAWSVQIPDMYVYEDTPAYLYEKQADVLLRITDYKGRKNPKQILALILKCYYYVSDDFISRVAGFTGIDSEKLKNMINKLKAIRQKKDDEIYFMKERIYCQYYRCIVYEKRLLYVPENTSTYIKLKYRHEKARRRLESMRKRMTSIRTDATNREVADVIGISKGAVDACLHRLKNKWKED